MFGAITPKKCLFRIQNLQIKHKAMLAHHALNLLQIPVNKTTIHLRKGQILFSVYIRNDAVTNFSNGECL